ncbi:MAG: serine hydrolase domain-containing protein [Aestuariibacter sp.]
MVNFRQSNIVRICIGCLWLSVLTSGCSDDNKIDEIVPTPIPIPIQLPAEEVLENAIQSEFEQSRIPGISVGVIKNGALVWAKGFGVGNFENQLTIDANSVFNVASIAKTFVGVALMKAVEDYNISIDEDVNRFGLPYLIDNPNLNGEEITLRHLATHTSGIRDNESAYMCGFIIKGTELNLFEALGLEPGCANPLITDFSSYLEAYLDSEGFYYDPEQNYAASGSFPGDTFEYSNVGAALAAKVVSNIVGMEFDAFTREAIFKPLGLENTYWEYPNVNAPENSPVSGAVEPPEVVSHYFVDDEGVMHEIPNYYAATYPDGSLKSSVSDLAKFMIEIMNQGGDLLSSESVNQLLSDEVIIQEGRRYGLFWDRIGDHWGHDGSDPGSFSMMYFHPELKSGFIVLSNTEPDSFPDGSFDNAMASILVAITEYIEN